MDKKGKGTGIAKHWWVLLVTCGLAGSSLGININTIGVFYTPVADALNVYRGTFAMHSTIAQIATGIVSLYIPKILTIHRFKHMMIFGVVLATLATMGMALTTQMWIFFILGALRGVGSALFSLVPLTILLNNWFEEKNGLAMSLAFGSAGVVGAIMSPVFTSLIESMGWEFSFVLMGLVMFLLAVPGLIYSYRFHPRDEGLLPYGMSQKEMEAHDEEVHEAVTSGMNKLKKKPVKYLSVPFITLLLLAYLHTSILGTFQHFPGFAESIGLPTNVGALMLSGVMFGNIGFKLLVGFLGEWLGTIKTVVAVILLNLVSVCLLIFFQVTPILIFAAFLFGTVFCIPPVGLPLLTNRFFGRSQASRVYPIISFASTIGGAFSMSIVGYIFDFTGSYVPAFWMAVVIHLVNLGLLFIGLKAVNQQVNN